MLVALIGSIGVASPASAQVAELTREENFRLEPNGGLLAVLGTGATLTVLQERETWVEGVLEGWVWARSLQVVDRGGFDLVVSAQGGERIRDRPQGAVLGELAEGTLLQEIERIPGWIRVRRRGWIWAASAEVDRAAAPAAPAPTGSRAASGTADTGATRVNPSSSALLTRGAMALLGAPGGDTLTTIGPGLELAVTGRQGPWVKVQLEGWILEPLAGDSAVAATEAGGAAPDPEGVAADPTGMRGRVVTWDLQFVSLERAEAVRTDFYEGEPFMLMRRLDEGPARFVYVAVPEARVDEVERFAPLERLSVQGRIRTGASALTGSPILDLIEMTRRR